MIGFKVVRDYGDELVSAVRNQGYARKGRTSRLPGRGPLAVFKTKADAQHFIHWWMDYGDRPPRTRLFVCKYKRSRARSLWSDGGRVLPNELPMGSDTADWVELGAEYPIHG